MDVSPSLRQHPAPPSHHRHRYGSPLPCMMDPVATPMTHRRGNSEGPSRPYYFTLCKGKESSSSTNIDSLPDELVFDILVRVAAEDIYDNALLVCRRWSDIIRTHEFIHAHLVRHSTPGLVITGSRLWRNNDRAFFVTMRKGRVVVSDFSYKFDDGVTKWSSCNGLILECHFWERAPRITNPAIKTHFAVPRMDREIKTPRSFSIAYSAASMEFKVVHLYMHFGVARCAVVTAGVNRSWSQICTRNLSREANVLLYYKYTITTGGYIHWTRDGNPLVVTLNVETETFEQYPVPPLQDHVRGCKYYRSTGKSLSLFIATDELAMDVWEMKPETGEWTKMCNIDLEPRKSEFERFRSKRDRIHSFITPEGWLRHREVVVLSVSHLSRFCIAYNVLTQELDFFKLPRDSRLKEL